MSDWPEFDAFIRKRNEEREQAEKKYLAEEKQRQIDFQKKLQTVQPTFIKLLSYWDKLITDYLSRIAKETWEEWKGPISKSFDITKSTDDQIKSSIGDQLGGAERTIDWSAQFKEYHYYVRVRIKDFKPINMVVEGRERHYTESVNESELKKALLIVFEEGPYCPPPQDPLAL